MSVCTLRSIYFLPSFLIESHTVVGRVLPLLPQELWGAVCSDILGEECARLLTRINNRPNTTGPLDRPAGSNVWALLHVSRALRAAMLRLLTHLLGP